MKIGLFLFALVVLVGFAAAPSDAQQTPQGTAKTAANKPAPISSVGTAGPRRGSLGGPVSKGAKVNGTGMRSKHERQ